MDIIEELTELNLPADQYAVFGSGLLGALGLRKVEDVDLLVTPELFDSLKESGWEYEEVEIEGRMRERVAFEVFEAYKDLWYGDKDVDVMAIIEDAMTIEDIPFISFEEFIKMKEAFGRPKDLKDLELIEKFLEENECDECECGEDH